MNALGLSKSRTKKVLDFEFKTKQSIQPSNEDETERNYANSQKGPGNSSAKDADLTRKRKGKRKGGRKKRQLLPYLVLPRGKRLSRRVILKLENEITAYKISQAIKVTKKLEAEAKKDLEEIVGLRPDRSETEWREDAKMRGSMLRVVHNRMYGIRRRAEKRRQKLEDATREELERKRYRLNPRDPNYDYIPGYQKKRHRITKERFIRCVDVNMLNEVIDANKELKYSPLWKKDLVLENLNCEEMQVLKDHLCQFEVLIEALKQGLFDYSEVNNLPMNKVAKKRREEDDDQPLGKYYCTEKILKLSKYKHTDLKKRTNNITTLSKYKQVLEFPKDEDEVLEKNKKRKQGWLEKVKSWLRKNPDKFAGSEDQKTNVKETKVKIKADNKKRSAPNISGKVNKAFPVSIFSAKRRSRKSNISLPKENKANKTPFPSPDPKRSQILPKPKSFIIDPAAATDRTKDPRPFSNFLSIKVPRDLNERRNFVHAIAESKKQDTVPHRQQTNEYDQALKYDMRKSHVEKRDPLQRLHRDEQDSDVWTNTDTTTTDDYASWRRLPTNVGKKDNLSGIRKKLAVDPSLPIRFLLLAIVIWEIGLFVKRVIDEVYYSILTFHLYRENIWLSQPHISSPEETYMLVIIEEWIHIIISLMSLSIIKKKNECISLLFAISLLIHSCVDLGKDAHDNIYTERRSTWLQLVILLLKAFINSIRICLFVAYHYACADYIRKSREFQHRKTKLHNQEINAKGTKGLKKRRLAWSWMTRHSRFQALKALKKKYPDVKDGRYPEEELNEIVHFLEGKELRLYAQKHNLHLGYPYNTLKDMKRYVFGETEASDYGEEEIEEELQRLSRRAARYMRRRSTPPLTLENWRRWKNHQLTPPEKNRKSRKKSKSTAPVTHPRKRNQSYQLTIGPSSDFAKLLLPGTLEEAAD